MDWQQLLSLGIVTLTAILIGRSYIRRRTSRTFSGCGANCSCSTQPPSPTRTPAP